MPGAPASALALGPRRHEREDDAGQLLRELPEPPSGVGVLRGGGPRGDRGVAALLLEAVRADVRQLLDGLRPR
jgi:hypothetical protein